LFDLHKSMVLSANTDTQVGNSNASGQNIVILL